MPETYPFTSQVILCILGSLHPMYVLTDPHRYSLLKLCTVFYLQLFAELHGVPKSITTYSVRVALCSDPLIHLSVVLDFADFHSECCIDLRSHHPKLCW